MEKALSPQVPGQSRGAEEVGVSRSEVVGSVSAQEVRKVWRGNVVKGFICDEENLELDSLLYGDVL